MSQQSLLFVLNELIALLKPECGETARYESEQILAHFLKKRRTDLYLSAKEQIPDSIQEKMKEVAITRLSGKPLSYILKSSYFYSREFLLSPAVLIPRPETELLVEHILNTEPRTKRHFLDLGTGSGIIAETLSTQRPDWSGIGIDISESALMIARLNCSPKIPLVCSDKLSSIKYGSRFDFIVSNPPYIPEKEWENLDRSVKEYEPALALRGGADGLDMYRYLAMEAKNYLTKDGSIYLEIGADQEKSVTEIFTNAKWRQIMCLKDLNKRARIVAASVS